MNRDTELTRLLTTLAARIKTRRKALDMTQEQLAEKVGLSSNYLGKLEMGAKTPSLDTIVRLATVLGMHVTDLLAEDDLLWDDEAQGIAKSLRSLPKNDAEFALSQFKGIVDHITKLRRPS